MKKALPLSAVLLAIVLLPSCEKKIECDATLCIKNISSTVVHYSWGSSVYTDSILPGASACVNVGPIEVSSTSTSTPTWYFESDHGNYAITVDECAENHEIN